LPWRNNQLGLLALQDGRLAEAELSFKKAMSIDPKDAEAQSNLGVLDSQQRKERGGRFPFSGKPIQSDPKYSKAYINLGLIFAQQRTSPRPSSNFARQFRWTPIMLALTLPWACCRSRPAAGLEAVQTFRTALTVEPGQRRHI